MCPFPSQTTNVMTDDSELGYHLCIYFIANNLVNPGNTDLEDTLSFQLQPHSCKTATATGSSDIAIWIRAWQKQGAALGGPVTTHDLCSKALTKLEEFAFLSLFPVQKNPKPINPLLVSSNEFYSAVVTQFEDGVIVGKKKKPSNIPSILFRTKEVPFVKTALEGKKSGYLLLYCMEESSS